MGVGVGVGFGLGLVGVALLNGLGARDFKFAGIWASLIFVSSFLCEAAYSVLGKPVVERAGILKTVTLALVAGSILNFLLDGGQTWSSARMLGARHWWMLIYLAMLCTVLGYSLWYRIIRETPVNVMALTIFVQPLAGVPMAVLVLGEPLHWGMAWGSAAIVAGLLCGMQFRTSGPEPATAAGR